MVLFDTAFSFSCRQCFLILNNINAIFFWPSYFPPPRAPHWAPMMGDLPPREGAQTRPINLARKPWRGTLDFIGWYFTAVLLLYSGCKATIYKLVCIKSQAGFEPGFGGILLEFGCYLSPLSHHGRLMPYLLSIDIFAVFLLMNGSCQNILFCFIVTQMLMPESNLVLVDHCQMI